MQIYFILIFYWLCINLIKNQINLDFSLPKNKKYKKMFVFFMGLGIFLVMSLRGEYVGSDLSNYKFQYYTDVLRPTELAYSYLNNYLRDLNFSFQQYLALLALFCTLVLSILYYKYSKNIFFSFYLYLTIGMFAMSLTGLRQTIAVMFTALAFMLMRKNRPVLFIIFIFIAYYFHNSAIIFFPVYLVRKIKLNKKTATIVYLFSILTFIFRKNIASLSLMVVPEKYLKYSHSFEIINVNPIVIIVSLLIPLACLFFWKNIDKKDENLMSIVFFFSCVTIVLNILSLEINLLERMSYYFSFYVMILIPNVIESIKNNKDRFIAKTLCLIFPLLNFIISTPGSSLKIDDYKFFWQ
ncbi:EpsG family protein [Carnobacterium maltaromaticum]|uniref:EpsG family protein n=1 Tax=Carnobacterium maltaromaticum TaxID=2751 RepID=UPI0039BDE146